MMENNKCPKCGAEAITTSEHIMYDCYECGGRYMEGGEYHESNRCLQYQLEQKEEEIRDTRLELSTSFNMGMDNEPLYKMAASVVCHALALQAVVDALEKEKRGLLQTARCPCGGWLEGVGYDIDRTHVTFECVGCGSQMCIDMAIWNQIKTRDVAEAAKGK